MYLLSDNYIRYYLNIANSELNKFIKKIIICFLGVFIVSYLNERDDLSLRKKTMTVIFLTMCDK